MATQRRSQNLAQLGSNAAAATEQQALQLLLIPMALIHGEEPLFNHRTACGCHGTQNIPINGHHAPAMAVEPQLGRLFLTKTACGGARLVVPGQKNHAQGGNALIRQRCYSGPERLQQGPGNGAEHACPVAGVPVTATAAPVLHATQAPQGLLQDPVARLAVQPGQKTNATAVPLPFQPIRPRRIPVRPDRTA